jgi:ligand-binding sensor domain-containing protein
MIGARALATRAPRASASAGARALLAGASLLALFAAEPAWCLWQTFGLADGLAAIQVRAIAEDRSENLWFATAYGASRYDGAAFRTFTLADGLVNEDVRAILSDQGGRVWFATAGGAGVFDGSRWAAYTTSDGLASNDVRALLQDHAGRIWFATGFGASRFDGTTWTSYHQSDGLAANQLSCVFEDHTGDLWFGTQGGGVSRFDGATWTTYTTVTTSGGLGDDWIECILETGDGVIWIGTRYGGLSRFDGVAWSHVTAAGSLTLSDVTGLREDRFHGLWVASSTGLARFDGRVWRAYTTADGLGGSMVAALAIDGSGNVWAATDNGVSRYDGEGWTSFTAAGLDTYGAQAVLEDGTGIVWAATAGGGVARYDRSAWSSVTVASTGGGLASDLVSALLQDSTGALWFGTSAGASRLDGTSWRTFTTADSLAGNNVTALARDSSGAVWLGTTTGLSRFDGVNWKSYTTAEGLPANRVRSLLVDRAGSLWCGTSAGVGHLQGTTWTRYSTADGLAGSNVYAILQDHAGTLWFGTQAGLSRFDGAAWRTYSTVDGLGLAWVLSLAETPDSVLWVGTAGGGVSRFDGDLWHTYSTGDGLPDGTVSAALVERSGSLWFGTASAAALYEPARVPPQTVITTPPPPLSANRLQTVHFVAAFRQILGIEFSTSFDSGPWSSWLRDDAWIGKDLADGVHTLRVVARDMLHHVDATPATATFEVAATPPAPVITSPVFRQPVRDTLVVRGTASATRFRSMRLDLRPAGASSWDPPVATTLAQSPAPVTDGVLARLDTPRLPDGDYELRLSVQDTLGLTGFATVTFVIDNVAPWAAQTTPALVSALDGGDVYTTNREAHVYIPPRGLARDAVVHLDPLDPLGVPATLPDGATRVAPGYAVTMEGVPLEKTAALDLSLSGDVAPPGTRLSLYVAGEDSVWHRLGGTLDAAGARIASPFSGAGSYAIFAAPSGGSLAPEALTLTLTPRVLSSRGPLATPSVRIGFVLARSATVRVTVHNRAGRLVRVVMSGQALGPGANLVSWDGRDEDHHDVVAGLYLVTVEALGETRTQTLGVVR